MNQAGFCFHFEYVQHPLFLARNLVLSFGLLLHFGFHRVHNVLRAAQYFQDLHHLGQDILLRRCSIQSVCADLGVGRGTWGHEKVVAQELLGSVFPDGSVLCEADRQYPFPHLFLCQSLCWVATVPGHNLQALSHSPRTAGSATEAPCFGVPAPSDCTWHSATHQESRNHPAISHSERASCHARFPFTQRTRPLAKSCFDTTEGTFHAA